MFTVFSGNNCWFWISSDGQFKDRSFKLCLPTSVHRPRGRKQITRRYGRRWQSNIGTIERGRHNRGTLMTSAGGEWRADGKTPQECARVTAVYHFSCARTGLEFADTQGDWRGRDFIMVGENGWEQYSGRFVVRNINASRTRPHGTVPTHSSYIRRTRRTVARGTCWGTSSHGVPFETGKGPKKTGRFRTAFRFVAKQHKRKSALAVYEHVISGFHYGNDVCTDGASGLVSIYASFGSERKIGTPIIIIAHIIITGLPVLGSMRPHQKIMLLRLNGNPIL